MGYKGNRGWCIFMKRIGIRKYGTMFILNVRVKYMSVQALSCIWPHLLMNESKFFSSGGGGRDWFDLI